VSRPLRFQPQPTSVNEGASRPNVEEFYLNPMMLKRKLSLVGVITVHSHIAPYQYILLIMFIVLHQENILRTKTLLF